MQIWKRHYMMKVHLTYMLINILHNPLQLYPAGILILLLVGNTLSNHMVVHEWGYGGFEECGAGIREHWLSFSLALI